MQLGAHSISLAVKDIAASKAFYTKLGFQEVGGDIEQHWVILRNAEHTIGLFQGMFDSNIMTFNPGWDRHAQPLEEFTDIRVIQSNLQAQGVELDSEVEAGSSGPGSIMLRDPDGNTILIDQHL